MLLMTCPWTQIVLTPVPLTFLLNGSTTIGNNEYGSGMRLDHGMLVGSVTSLYPNPSRQSQLPVRVPRPHAASRRSIGNFMLSTRN